MRTHSLPSSRATHAPSGTLASAHRLLVLALRVVATVVVLYLAFSVARLVLAGPPIRVIVFPKDFVGRAVVVKDPVHGVPLRTRGLWHREIIIPIPSSGFLAVRDFGPFHLMTQEKVILNDGTVIDGTSPWARYPSRFRYTGGADATLEKALARYKEPNNHLDCMVYELASTPQFQNFIPRPAPLSP